MNLNITRPDGQIDTYTIDPKGIELSPFLGTLIGNNDNDNGQSDQEDDGLDEFEISLPVTFDDKYMTIVANYLTYFARESLPLKLAIPITQAKEEILHPRIYEWLQNFSFNELAKFREVCMYFDLVPLIEQIDGILAISLVKKPKEVFKDFHEPTLTLASKDSVVDEFPILT